MSNFAPLKPRLSRIALTFAALISISAVATPASAQERFEDRYPYRGNIYDNQNYRHHQRHHHRHDNDGFFSFGLGGPVYSDPPYYYAPPPQYYYPPPAYYQPGPSFNLTIPLAN